MTDLDKKPSVRETILYTGAKLTSGDRNAQYGEPVQNMQDIGDLWTTYLVGKYGGNVIDPATFHFTGEDVAHFMTLMKIARCFNDVAVADNYIDAAVYQAIAGECADAAG